MVAANAVYVPAPLAALAELAVFVRTQSER